jgi:hypothetical protein
MHTLLITFAPDSPESRSLVEDIRTALDPGVFRASTKPARETTIVDIALANVVLFGAQRAGASEIPADYDELLRVFTGANLAGKAGALFSAGGDRPSARLRKVLRDTDITLLDEDPVFSADSAARQGEIAAWAGKLSALARGTRNAAG